MRKKSVWEKSQESFRRTRKLQIRNAMRGAAHPWTLPYTRDQFSKLSHHKDKLELFNDKIGNIFPLILDLVSQGWSIRKVERQMGLTHRMLWRWLEVRKVLADEVRRARRLRGSVGVGADAMEAPHQEL